MQYCYCLSKILMKMAFIWEKNLNIIWFEMFVWQMTMTITCSLIDYVFKDAIRWYFFWFSWLQFRSTLIYEKCCFCWFNKILFTEILWFMRESNSIMMKFLFFFTKIAISNKKKLKLVLQINWLWNHLIRKITASLSTINEPISIAYINADN